MILKQHHFSSKDEASEQILASNFGELLTKCNAQITVENRGSSPSNTQKSAFSLDHHLVLLSQIF